MGLLAVFFDFGSDELVFEIVLVILVFAIGQLAVDQVAQCVVGVFDAVVFFEAVAAGKVGVGRGFQTTLSCGIEFVPMNLEIYAGYGLLIRFKIYLTHLFFVYKISNIFYLHLRKQNIHVRDKPH